MANAHTCDDPACALCIPEFLRRKEGDQPTGCADYRIVSMPPFVPVRKIKRRKTSAQVAALERLGYAASAIFRLTLEDAMFIIAKRTEAPPRNRKRRGKEYAE